jgi:vacuole morphology and inheritance protein 14|eukprot:Transcript_8232.p1 GENE.Transcript_8232~~Transcript_8232.p1  ORF type:complete len:320 (-),score=139.39 Transcript_8232:134-1093(-)
MLLQKSGPRVMQLSQQIWPALFKCLSNTSEEVVRLDIEALARMAPTEEHFGPLVEHLLHLFRRERVLLEKRGALIVRQLCEHLAPRKVFVTLAGGLRSEEDLEFASQMVQQLNLILLTTPEAIELRSRLKQSTASAEGATLFQTLYPAWSHNPVALLSMCLLAQLHEHASELVLQFAEIEISVAFLLQIDKLVQLVESPIFTHVRLQLLEPDQHPFLLKALWGILMLLPQSPAFHTLKNRLAAVPEIGLLRLQLELRKPAAPAERAVQPPGGTIDFRALLKTYRAVQEKHRSCLLRQAQVRRASAAASMGSLTAAAAAP